MTFKIHTAKLLHLNFSSKIHASINLGPCSKQASKGLNFGGSIFPDKYEEQNLSGIKHASKLVWKNFHSLKTPGWGGVNVSLAKAVM